MRIAEVAYPLPLNRTFDYEVPPSLSESLKAGIRVRAPFGARVRSDGLVLLVRDGEPKQKLKAVAAVLDPDPILTEELLELARWLSRRCCAPIGECLKVMLPANLRRSKRGIKTDAGGWEARARTRSAPRFELTPGQAEALRTLGGRLEGRSYSADLVFGVPASGKTEVYIRLIRQAVKDGGQALFLVPEISLTKPFFDDFQASLGLPVAIWHSQAGAKYRRRAWTGLRSGAVRVVVGARSASLLPFLDLKLAVIDEEQDESYKQDEQVPFYHARDVVLHRARGFGASVVLGSATPSIEAFSLAERGELGLIRMDERVSRTTSRPSVRIIDRPQAGGCLSDELVEALRDCLSKKEQAIMLVNRRGYSNFIICRKCSWVARCPTCSVAYIHHQRPEGESLFGHQLLCHHCGRTSEVPASCGRCGQGPLRFAGVGTQKVVAELRARLPGVRVLRMDRDTVAKEKPGTEEGIYDSFRKGSADVLVGTKLVAKGFHFPKVTVVGVVDADTMLGMPDFRAAERTVQLLVQASGRSGRAERPGTVLLQTGQPAHYAIQAVARGDYAAFARKEIGLRAELSYPPASSLARVVLSGLDEKAVRKAAEAAAKLLRGEGDESEVLGPAPCVHARLHGRFRYHILLKVREGADPGARLAPVLGFKPPSSVRMKVNVEPYDFL